MSSSTQSQTTQKLHADKGASSIGSQDIGQDSSNADSDVSDTLSDIDDAEVVRYLNNKKEALYKSIIWEVMNRDYVKGKSKKRGRKAKKAAPEKKAAKISTEMDNKKRLSSRINYDVLKKLNEEDGNYAPGLEEGTESICGSRGDMQHSNEKFNKVAHNSGGSCDDEFEQENAYSEEAEAGQDYIDDTYLANDDYNGYSDEECDFF